MFKVTVTDEVILFDKAILPDDWEEKRIEQPYGELGGTYLGYRQFEANHWYLRRDTKKPEYSGTYSEWRSYMSRLKDMNYSNLDARYPYYCSYAWEPSSFYKYEGSLYCGGANCL